MSRSRPSSMPGGQAVAWALLSQTIWLPLLGIDLHDRWQSAIREQRRIAEATKALQNGRGRDRLVARSAARFSSGPQAQPTTGLLLGAAASQATAALDEARRLIDRQRSDLLVRPSVQQQAASVSSPDPTPEPTVSRGSAAPPSLAPLPNRGPAPLAGADPFVHGFNRAELLGGSIGPSDLGGPLVHPLAMAERARWASSSDPLAPLPSQWREPMRRALQELRVPGRSRATVTNARIVHVPSTHVSRSTAVPLAVQADGSVDILTTPDDPRVVDEIRQWSARQAPDRSGGVTAAVVNLEPLPDGPETLRPSSRPSQPTSPAAKPASASLSAPAAQVSPAPRAAADAPEPSAPEPQAVAPMPATPVAAAPVVHPVAPPPPVEPAPLAAPQEVSVAPVSAAPALP